MAVLRDLRRVIQRLGDDTEGGVSTGPSAGAKVNNCLDPGPEEDFVTCAHCDENKRHDKCNTADLHAATLLDYDTLYS